MPKPLSNDSITSADWREQCILYLLGELAANQTAIFEQRLASSPELAEELLRQADLIALLSTGSCQSPTHDQLKKTPLPCTSRSPLAQPMMVTLVAIAACIAMVVVNVYPHAVTQNSVAVRSETPAMAGGVSEDLLIARAWADNQFDSLMTDSGWVDPEIDDTVVAGSDEPADIDSTLSWMFIAVSDSASGFESDALGTDAIDAEATNDG